MDVKILMEHIKIKLIISIIIGFTFCNNLHSQVNPIVITGNISLSSQYFEGTNSPYGFSPKPLDYTSNSRLSLQYGISRLNLIFNKPLTYFKSGQPDRYYTVEYLNPWFTARYGDLSPFFTQAITGFIRVAGGEFKLNLKGVAELTTLYGKSKIASPTKGFILGTYDQKFYGGRIKINPFNTINVGVSVVKIKDDLSSWNYKESLFRNPAKDNLILGSDLSIFFLNRRANLTVEYAISYFNSDQTAETTNAEIERDSKVLDWFTRRKFVQRYINFNDSTKSGEIIAGKLVLPISTSRFTVEYRRASKSYFSLATPYEQSDNERYRITNNTILFSGLINFMFSGDYSRSNISKTKQFTSHFVNILANLTIVPKNFPKITIGWRENERFNNVPVPEPKSWDRRIKTSMKSANLSVSNDLGIGNFPLTITGSIMANWYTDKIRSSSDYESYSIQFYTQTLPPSRFSWTTQLGYSINQKKSTKIKLEYYQLFIKEGYDIITDKLHIYAIEVINLERTKNYQQRTNNFTWGAGARWMPKIGTSIEFEWQYNTFRNYIYTDYNHTQQFFELKITYGI